MKKILLMMVLLSFVCSALNLTNTTCVESWECQDWSLCRDDKQVRICKDINKCGSITERPLMIQNCEDNRSLINITSIYNSSINISGALNISNETEIYTYFENIVNTSNETLDKEIINQLINISNALNDTRALDNLVGTPQDVNKNDTPINPTIEPKKGLSETTLIIGAFVFIGLVFIGGLIFLIFKD